MGFVVMADLDLSVACAVLVICYFHQKWVWFTVGWQPARPRACDVACAVLCCVIRVVLVLLPNSYSCRVIGWRWSIWGSDYCRCRIIWVFCDVSCCRQLLDEEHMNILFSRMILESSSTFVPASCTHPWSCCKVASRSSVLWGSLPTCLSRISLARSCLVVALLLIVVTDVGG